MNTLYVCANDETILGGTYLSVIGDRDAAGAMVRAACDVIDAGYNTESKIDSQFRDWHGGRFCQFYERHGNVACAKDAPMWVHHLANAADDAMDAERNRRSIGAEDNDREFYASELEAGADVEGFTFNIENYLLGCRISKCTPDSVAAALRANDAKLLVVLQV